jgi:hypothetical protein
MAGRYTVHGTLHSLRTIFSLSCLVQALGLLEHVLAEHAFVQARCGDGRHVVHVLGVHRLRELAHVARALDVDLDLALLVGRQVVHRGQVVDRVHRALQSLDVVAADAQLLRGEVAGHGHGARLVDAPELVQVGHLAFAAGTHQERHGGAAPGQQGLDETLADETGGTGDEIVHGLLQGDKVVPNRFGPPGRFDGLLRRILGKAAPRPLRGNPKPAR